MRLDKEFKNGVKREMKEADYVGSRIFVRIVVVLFVIGLLSSGGYWKSIFGWILPEDSDEVEGCLAYLDI